MGATNITTKSAAIQLTPANLMRSKAPTPLLLVLRVQIRSIATNLNAVFAKPQDFGV
ncbi:hypothetical protein U1Q18_027403, partial [Sarracenia purpurea var. burkii]